MLSQDLGKVSPGFTGIVRANVTDIWAIVKQWAPSLWIKECGGVPVEFHVLTGESGEQVGATRATVVGTGVVVEQLVAVDADEHYLTWKCISDPRSINPFPGTFVNYVNTLRFTPLTDNTQTLADWNGTFWTDLDMMDDMQQLLADFYREALLALEKQLIATKTSKAPRLEFTQKQQQQRRQADGQGKGHSFLHDDAGEPIIVTDTILIVATAFQDAGQQLCLVSLLAA